MVVHSNSLRRQQQISSVFDKFFVEHNGRAYESRPKAHELCPKFYAFRLTRAQCEIATEDWLSHNEGEGCSPAVRLMVHEWDKENRRFDLEYNGIFVMGDIDSHCIGY